MNAPQIIFGWLNWGATENKQDSIISAINNPLTYNFIQSEEDITYKYYGFASIEWWRIKRKTLSTWIWMLTDWAWDYDTAWLNKSSHTYTYF